MRVVLQSAALGALRGADLDLAPGRYVVLSNEPGTLEALLALLSGREPPRSGRVLLDGNAPARTPSLRRRIAAVFEDESLPPAATTLGAVERALALRGQASSLARAALAGAELAHLSDVNPGALAERDVRAVALALALAHDGAELLLLHEPLTTAFPRRALLEALEQRTLQGATIIVTTASSADAVTLGGEWLCVELGRLRAAAPPRLGVGPWQRVVVACSNAAELARALHDSPLGLAVELGVEPGTVNVTGSALDVTVRELIALSRARGLELTRIEPVAPPVEALLAARAGFARGAYEAARIAALGVPPVPPAALAPSAAPSPLNDAPAVPPGGAS
jgi:ABC-type nitrate/sulfonate/bicarbonate transport system ATPase subunit